MIDLDAMMMPRLASQKNGGTETKTVLSARSVMIGSNLKPDAVQNHHVAQSPLTKDQLVATETSLVLKSEVKVSNDSATIDHPKTGLTQNLSKSLQISGPLISQRAIGLMTG